jgi:hypothetical protein
LLAALEQEGQFGVVKAEQLQNRGVQIVDVNGIIHGAQSEFIRCADRFAAFNAAARELCGEAVRIVIPPDMAASGNGAITFLLHAALPCRTVPEQQH